MNSSHSHSERGTNSSVTDGFPAVANFVSIDPDGETYVFRTLANLTARKLLDSGSELIALETMQRSLDQQAWRRRMLSCVFRYAREGFSRTMHS